MPAVAKAKLNDTLRREGPGGRGRHSEASGARRRKYAWNWTNLAGERRSGLTPKHDHETALLLVLGRTTAIHPMRRMGALTALRGS